MRNRLLTLAGAFALLAVLGKFYAAPVLAQVRAALVKNIDERGRTPFTQHLNCDNTGSTGCQAFFSAVPANKRLVIEHVNGAVQTASNLSNVAFGSALATLQFIPFQLQSTAGADNIYIANQPLLAYFEAGQAPFYFVIIQPGATEFINGQLTITGYSVDLTQ
jgi:hypothetical protein